MKVETEGRDAGWHLPLPAGRAASRSRSPGRRGLGAGFPVQQSQTMSAHLAVCAFSLFFFAPELASNLSPGRGQGLEPVPSTGHQRVLPFRPDPYQAPG